MMKIGFLITARLKSTRLPLKILLDLNGRTVIERVIERAKSVSGIDGVVLCTSPNSQDQPLIKIAEECGISCYLGDEDDVLNRLLSASEHFGYDAFLSITADNPLFSIETSQMTLDWFLEKPRDFIFTRNLPLGCATTLLSTKALKVVNHIKGTTNTEIWGPFVKRSDIFNIGELIVQNSTYSEERRLTLDYPEDYLLFQAIFKELKNTKSVEPKLNEVFKVIRNKEELWNINSNCKQRVINEEQLRKINKSISIKRKQAIIFAEEIELNLSPNHTTKKINI